MQRSATPARAAERALRGIVIVAELALIGVLIATAASYAAVYIARWLDDVAYHIPGAVRIAKHWNPYFVDSPVDSHWYPAGAETVVAVFVAISGSINSTNASGGLCFVLVCFLVYRAAGLWTSDLVARLAAVLCAASIPLLLAQCLAFYVDIHLALIAFASLYLQAAALQRRDPQRAWAALAVALLAPSVKYAGLVYLAVLAPGCLFCVWQIGAARRPVGWRAVAVVAALLFTSGFYVRNWVERGNPLYPIGLPAWLRPIAALSPAAYEADQDLLAAVETSRQASQLPQPLLPRSWTKVTLRPDMTDDGFGAAGAVALAGALLSLVFVRHLDPRRRQAWLIPVVETAFIVLLLPTHTTGPRYVLILPLVASLSPAVLMAARGGSSRMTARILSGVIVATAGVYVASNVLGDDTEWTSLRSAAARLRPYSPHGLRALGFAQPGNLRIGYTSGFSNMIALLYDRGLTNELVPLHYRNYILNRGPEHATPEEFIAHVRGLDLDYIQIFDPRYPGADLLRDNFPDKVWLWDQRSSTSVPFVPPQP